LKTHAAVPNGDLKQIAVVFVPSADIGAAGERRASAALGRNIVATEAAHHEPS